MKTGASKEAPVFCVARVYCPPVGAGHARDPSAGSTLPLLRHCRTTALVWVFERRFGMPERSLQIVKAQSCRLGTLRLRRSGPCPRNPPRRKQIPQAPAHPTTCRSELAREPVGAAPGLSRTKSAPTLHACAWAGPHPNAGCAPSSEGEGL